MSHCDRCGAKTTGYLCQPCAAELHERYELLERQREERYQPGGRDWRALADEMNGEYDEDEPTDLIDMACKYKW